MTSTRQLSDDREQGGYSLTELLTVLAIFSLFVVAAGPNVGNFYETYLLRTNARKVSTCLKLGRRGDASR